MQPYRLVLADDHTLFRAGIRALLDDFDWVKVIAEAGNGVDALELIAQHQPDIAVLDITMGGMSGLELSNRIAKEHSNVRVVILSMHANKEYVLQALRSGAAAYVLKDADTVELGLALRAVMRGETYLSPAISTQVVAGFVNQYRNNSLEQLSQRQQDTLRLIAEGYTTQEIARQMGISTKTVEKHRAQLMERLDIHDVAGLVRYAIREGVITPDS
jgi:DNA-binding NarL/FixJ family response regulator